MAYSVLFLLRALPILWTLLYTTTNATLVKGQLPDLSLIKNFIDYYIKPFMQNIMPAFNKVHFRTEETLVETTIREKIKELRPYLEDDDDKVDTEYNLTLDGNEETTIIEFLPGIQRNGPVNGSKEHKQDPFKAHIKKYKKMREKIEDMLQEEEISPDAKDLVVKTLDDIIAQLVESQCTWKSVDRPDKVFRDGQLHNSLSRIRNLTEEEWADLKQKYQKFLENKVLQESSFLNMFHEFFTKVINDTRHLTTQYKIRCQLIEVNNRTKTGLRKNPGGDKNICDNFKLCSTELKEFMLDFYKHLNDTTVSAFRNYAAMYVRDVNMDVELDKDLEVATINKLGDVVERKVDKTFRKETNKLKLDVKKDRTENMRHMTDYIKTTIEHVKKNVKKRVDNDLRTLKTKLYLLIKDDLDVNLDVDLNNLERMYIERLCTLFVLCNGRYSSRRQGDGMVLDKRGVYVKVQVTFDDELKEGLSSAKNKLKQFLKNNLSDNRRFNKQYFRSKYSNLTVTRTTLFGKPTEMSQLQRIDVPLNEI